MLRIYSLVSSFPGRRGSTSIETLERKMKPKGMSYLKIGIEEEEEGGERQEEDQELEEGDEEEAEGINGNIPSDTGALISTEFKVYKRRWFGLMQLVLLNIIVSWDWITFSPVANTAAAFFSTTPSTINWLSTAFLLAFPIASPLVLHTLSSSGPRPAILISSVFILLGNWIRYAGTRASPPSYAVTMSGQILVGIAQPFVLAAPTRYSDLWFTPAGRVSATAIASLANPFGAALGQVITPLLVSTPNDIPSMTFLVAIISSLATIPSLFVPPGPPTPIGPSNTKQKLSLSAQLHRLSRNANFWILALLFAIYVGLFNALSTLLTQILTPYGRSETEAGIAGGLLILIGLLSAAILAPLVDRTRRPLSFIRILVPLLAFAYAAFVWAPSAHSIAVVYMACAALGAASFTLVPIALEWLADATYPVGPECGSVVCWAAGQLLGAGMLVAAGALGAGAEGKPPWNLHAALVAAAVVGGVVAPGAFLLGWIRPVGKGRS